MRIYQNIKDYFNDITKPNNYIGNKELLLLNSIRLRFFKDQFKLYYVQHYIKNHKGDESIDINPFFE